MGELFYISISGVPGVCSFELLGAVKVFGYIGQTTLQQLYLIIEFRILSSCFKKNECYNYLKGDFFIIRNRKMQRNRNTHFDDVREEGNPRIPDSENDQESVGNPENNITEIPPIIAKVLRGGIRWINRFCEKAPAIALEAYPKIWQALGRGIVGNLRTRTHQSMMRRRPWFNDEIQPNENPNRKDYHQIVEEVIRIYNQEHFDDGKKAFYKFHPDRVSNQTFLKILDTVLTPEVIESIETRDSGLATKLIAGKTIGETLLVFSNNDQIYFGFDLLEAYLPPSVFEIISKSSQGTDDLFNKDRDCDLLEITDRVGESIEQGCALSGRKKRYSTTEVLRMFMEETQGDMSLSMYLLAAFYKDHARKLKGMNFILNGKYDQTWIKDHLMDELSDFLPFTSIPSDQYSEVKSMDIIGFDAIKAKVIKILPFKFLHDDTEDYDNPAVKIDFDYSLLNQQGKLYHAANMVALLDRLSPEIITIMMLGEYMTSGARQGLSKLLSDLRIATDLYKLQEIFARLTVKDK